MGRTELVDPWLSNGRSNFRTIKEIVASAVTPGMSDGEKAMALWRQQIQHRYHSSAGGEDLGDPVKVFNIYGLNPCGKDAMMMGGLWKQVGLKGAPARLVGHAIAQVYYDGGWHVMDGDLGMIYLLRDNETLASDRQLARDHDLVKRTHTMGILVDDSRTRDEVRVLKLAARDDVAFDAAIAAVEAAAAKAGIRRIAVRCQSRYDDAFHRLIARGYRVRWTDLRMTYEGYPEQHVERGVVFSNWEI